MRETKALVLLAVLLLLALVWVSLLAVWANECGNAGGAFIVPQNSWPVCVAGVKP